MPLDATAAAALEAAAARVLAQESGGPGSAALALGARHCCERLIERFGGLVGEVGIRMLLGRSLSLTRASHPWIAEWDPSRSPLDWAPLVASFEQQEANVAQAGFANLFANLVGVLRRLIGDGLVFRVLHDAWPAHFDREGPTEKT